MLSDPGPQIDVRRTEPGSLTALTAWIRPTQGPASLLSLAAASSGGFPFLVAKRERAEQRGKLFGPLRNHDHVGHHICLCFSPETGPIQRSRSPLDFLPACAWFV